MRRIIFTRLGSRSMVLGGLVAAASLWMVARTINNWQWITFVRETRLSRSPLPFGTDLSALRDQMTSDAKWTLLLPESAVASACVLLLDAPDKSQRMNALVVGEHDLRFLNCHSSAGPTRTMAILKEMPQRALLYSMQDQDFALLDESYRVVYGSTRVKDLTQMGSIMRLYVHSGASMPF